MKKKYESPEAKKLEFNYTEVVTASDTPGPSNSGMHKEWVWSGNQTFPSCTGCSKQQRWVPNC